MSHESEELGLASPSILIPFVLVTLIWSSTWLVIKDQLGADFGAQAGAVPPPWSVTYRFVLASAAMFVIAKVQGESLSIGRTGHAIAALIGIPQFALNFNFVYAAEQVVTSGIVAVVFALLIVPNALFSRLFFGHRMGGRFLAGSAIAIGGVALLFIAEVRVADVSAWAVVIGIGCTLLGVLSASVANVAQASARVRTHKVVPLLAWSMVYGALFDALLATILSGPPAFDPRPSYWLGVAYLGLAASALAFTLYFRILRVVGPAKAAYSSLLVPAVAMLLSTVFEDYRWTWLAAGGGVLTMIGLVIAMGGRKVQAPMPPAD